MVLIKNPKHISNFDSLWDYPALEFRAPLSVHVDDRLCSPACDGVPGDQVTDGGLLLSDRSLQLGSNTLVTSALGASSKGPNPLCAIVWVLPKVSNCPGDVR